MSRKSIEPRSRQHRDDALDLVRCGGQQPVVAGLALGGGLQDELRHMRFDCGRDVVRGNPGHHLVEGRAHDLDQLRTVARHDAISCSVAGKIAAVLLTSHTQDRECHQTKVTLERVEVHKTAAERSAAPGFYMWFIYRRAIASDSPAGRVCLDGDRKNKYREDDDVDRVHAAAAARRLLRSRPWRAHTCGARP